MYATPRGNAQGRVLTPGTERRLRQLETEVGRRRAWSGARLGFLIHQIQQPNADRGLWRELESKVASRRVWKTPRVTHLIEQVKEGQAPEVNLPDELAHDGE